MINSSQVISTSEFGSAEGVFSHDLSVIHHYNNEAAFDKYKVTVIYYPRLER